MESLPGSLESLHLGFESCPLGAVGAQALAQAMPQNLSALHLALDWCNVQDARGSGRKRALWACRFEREDTDFCSPPNFMTPPSPPPNWRKISRALPPPPPVTGNSKEFVETMLVSTCLWELGLTILKRTQHGFTERGLEFLED